MTDKKLQIELFEVEKFYNQGEENEVHALKDINLRVVEGEIVCLRGPSGSGKSTLLCLMGCVFGASSGRVAVGGLQLQRMPDEYLTRYRRETIGFIFQHFNILPQLSVEQNIVLPLLPLGVSPAERQKRAEPLMRRFGIEHRKKFKASQISGGELQRVAIARALINNPQIILADEPTAHLDTTRSLELMDHLLTLREDGKTIILTSHDPLITEHPALDRVIDMQDGCISCGGSPCS
ncbi:MAG: ABC transporter ATP-binding protein [Desulfocapsa sp.]|nr:MAG: ABC transporter ATP-binding protein [Desulfocapsa sp.]